MASSKQIRRLATHPADMMRFEATGKLPAGARPASPLITLLELIGARDCDLIRGLTVDHRLGYAASRVFTTAAHALRWAKPSDEVFGEFPAESYRVKRFSTRLRLDDLEPCCSGIDAGIAKRRPELL